MSTKYKFLLNTILVMIVLSVILGICYKYYDKNVKPDFYVETSGNLSINYLGKKEISIKSGSKKAIFSVTNNSDKKVLYSIIFADARNYNKDIKIVIKSGNQNFNVNYMDSESKTIKILDNIPLQPHETLDYEIDIKNEGSKKFHCDVLITEVQSDINSFDKIILANNEVHDMKSNSNVSSALEDEGLITDVDSNGNTYYFRGKVENNYVDFAGYIWRIVRINGDQTVRIVLDKNLETVHNYTSNQEEFSYASSDIKSFLNEWYNLYLADYDSLIAQGNYCDDMNKVEGANNLNAYIRIITNNIPSFNCLGESISDKIGLLTVDEVIMAGLGVKEKNASFYLYNKDINSYWTMSGAQFKDGNYYPFIISNGEQLEYNTDASLNRGVRPVINIKSTVTVTGDGTINNPYKINKSLT